MRQAPKTMQPKREFAVDPESDEMDEVFDLTKPTYLSPIDTPNRRGELPSHLSMVEARLARCRLNVEFFPTPVRGLLIGECPGPSTGRATPLFPHPPTSSAGRLMEMSRLRPDDYLGHLYRKNLVDDREWSKSRARERARTIVTALFEMPRDLRVVMLGKKVGKAFEVKPLEFWRAIELTSGQTAVVVPHPSGVNLVYNQKRARRLTRAWMRWATLGEEQPPDEPNQ